jgi:hypothetical protein
MSYTQVSGLSSAQSLTIPNGAMGMLVQAESQNVRYRTDGVDPTGSSGMLLYAGDPSVAVYGQGAMIGFRAIQTAASALLNVTFLYS